MSLAKKLVSLLRKRRILSMEELRKGLDNCSRVSVFRALRKCDYHSSYSHAGKYYTLSESTRFNESGLWQCGEVRFSRHGTLKETTYRLIEDCEAGYRHEELQVLLHVRLHNTLLDLIKEQRVRRTGKEKEYLYVSANHRRAKQQERKREELVRASSPVPSEVVIEVLAEIIRDSQICIDASRLTQRLLEKGKGVSQRQVAQVLDLYGVKKTLDTK